MAEQETSPPRPPAGWTTELERLERQLAELALAVELDEEREDLASRMATVKRRRDVLAHAIAERQRAAGAARTPPRRPPRQATGRPAPPAAPRRQPPPAPPRVHVAPLPEASSRSVQTLMLGLGGLLLGIAAIVFVGVAITELEPVSQLVILLAVAALFLAVGPPVASRGLTATAETLAAVGLVVFAVAAYPLWTTGVVDGIPRTVYGGLVALSTAVIATGYHLLTRLAVPAWVALLAVQPVLPLLAAPLVGGEAGWALVFTLVATHNVVLARAIRERLLGYLGWALTGLAAAAALGFSLAGLFLAGTVGAAVAPAVTLVLAALVGVVAAVGYGRQPVPDLAAGVLALAVIIAGSRLVAMALPGRALLPIAAIMTATALSVLLLPPEWRRGPRRASAWAIAAYGVVLAALALRAGAATLVWPPWPDDLTGYRSDLASAVGPATWQLAVTAAAATVGAGLSLPAAYRREITVVGAALAALSAPASLALPPTAGAWVLAVVAAGLALTGLTVTTARGAVAHTVAAGLVALAAVGASLAGPHLTAAILAALSVAGMLTASIPRRAVAEPVGNWAAAAVTVTLPAAAATGTYAAGYGTDEVLAATFAAVCGTLGYAALVQLRDQFTPVPVRVGASLGAAGATFGAFTARADPVDLGIASLLAIAALAILLTPRVDAIRRPGRWYDGAEIAAAAVTAGVVATLARITALALPISGADAGIATAATIVLAVTLAVRVLPADMRRGPVLGVGVVGALVAGLAGVAAVASAGQALGALDPVWNADLTQWPPTSTVANLSWGAPLALLMLAVAAAAVLTPWPGPLRFRPAPAPGRSRGAGAEATALADRPANHHVSAWLTVLATVGTPVPLELPWWTPAALSVTVASGYALSAALRRSPAGAHGLAAAGLVLYATLASLARPGTTAAVLGVVVLVGAVVAALALIQVPPDPRLRVGGTAMTAALLAMPGALAALATDAGQGRGSGLLAALGGATLGLALVAMLRQPIEPYLPYATVGITGAATGTALATLSSDTHPTSVYAAAAVLLAVLAELIRHEQRRRRRIRRDSTPPRTLVTPPMGALLASAPPAVLALIGIAPALAAALIDPYQALWAIWQGPPEALTNTDQVPAASVLAALLLTLAAALAAVGFGGAVTRQAVVLVAPGLAVTVLIAPAALDAPWPVGTVAALLVFTISMLGVAMTPPPPLRREARPLRAARVLVLAIGLAAGGAGLAGSFAEESLTWGTFGGAIGVGVAAALGGKTRLGRVLGWLGAAAAAQAFALVTAYLVGATWPQSSFALLAVAAVALLVAGRLDRLRRPGAAPELAAVEWLGGYVSITFAVGLALSSIPDLAALLFGAGPVLGLAALRPGRTHRERRTLWWLAATSEVLAAWIMTFLFGVGLIEAYTLPFALFAMVVGALELRYRPELSSWVTYGPGLIAALGPSLLLVITTTSPSPARQVYVILGGVAALLLGSRLRQRAPLIIGSVVTAIAALHLLSLAGPWLILIPLGILLLVLGANREKHQRDLERLRGAYSRMR
jgi:hypothetical protein